MSCKLQHINPHSCCPSPWRGLAAVQDALADRDLVHRQTAATVVQHLALGVAGLSCEDALTHLLNFVWPNVFEESPHLINGVMGAIDGCRLALGPCVVLHYTLQVRRGRTLWVFDICCMPGCESCSHMCRLPRDPRGACCLLIQGVGAEGGKGGRGKEATSCCDKNFYIPALKCRARRYCAGVADSCRHVWYLQNANQLSFYHAPPPALCT